MARELRVYDDTKGHGACRSCQAPLTWFQLTSGKRHPFNGSEPVYLRTEHDPATHRLIGVLSTDDSHFATCPQSRDWSRKSHAGQ